MLIKTPLPSYIETDLLSKGKHPSSDLPEGAKGEGGGGKSSPELKKNVDSIGIINTLVPSLQPKCISNHM